MGSHADVWNERKKQLSQLDFTNMPRQLQEKLPKQYHRIRCQICDNSYPTLKQLNQHQEMAHPEFWAVKVVAKKAIKEEMTCKVCGKQFGSRKTLKYHMFSHTGGHPFQCEECGAGFTDSYKLKRHQQSHTGQWKYTCEVRGKGFRDLNKYREVHCKQAHPEVYQLWKSQKMAIENHLEM